METEKTLINIGNLVVRKTDLIVEKAGYGDCLRS